MARRQGISKNLSSEPAKDKKRDSRRTIMEGAEKTDDTDRDLVHGEGGTLEAGTSESLNHDD